MKIRVYYPLRSGELRLRTDLDWETDVQPRRAAKDRSWCEFELPDDVPFRYFKPLHLGNGSTRWSQGDNFLAIRGGRGPLGVYPHFSPDSTCHECTLHVVPSSFSERGYAARVFLPPGYDENSLARYPVLYMQDGQNLFFPEEAFNGGHWKVAETLKLLETMNLIRRVIVVGVYPRDRMEEYTAPGYQRYGRFLVEELKPWVDRHYRTMAGPRDTAVMGSSLGGVVSFYLGWQWPEVFGQVGCMSSTFGYRDDLLSRVAAEGKRPFRVYLDSGWPHDNYEVTRSMHRALLNRGYQNGKDLLYLAFPEGTHDEKSWALRAHLPFQFFFRGP